MAASVTHSAGSGRLTAPMKLRSAMKHQAGIIDQVEPGEIARGERRRLGRLPGRDQDVLAPELRHVDRNAEHHRGPKSHAQRAAHHARLACAESLRGQRRDRGHEAHAEHEAEEQDQVREPDRRDRAVAEPADQREVGRHHGDLAELGQRDRPAQASTVSTISARQIARSSARRGRGYGSRRGHGAAP